MAGFLERLGRMCARYRRVVYAVWGVIAVAVGYLGMTGGGAFVEIDRLQGTESQVAFDAMEHEFPEFSGPPAVIVFHPQDGVALTDWRVADNVGKSINKVRQLPRVAEVQNPYSEFGGGLRSDNVVVAVAHFKGTARDLEPADLDALEAATEDARKAGVTVEFGGIVTTVLNQPKGGWQEGIGLAVAAIILLIAFRSVIAALVPIIISLSALAVALALILFGAAQWDVHPTAPLVAAMLGLGAGIDYALFIVTRHRRELDALGGASGAPRRSSDVETAIGRALATSGHAVVFAGGTVVFAICGLWLSGFAFIGRIGLVSAVAVAMTVLAALTLLPAVLGTIGDRIDQYRLPRLGGRNRRRQAAGAPEVNGWERWVRHVGRHAWPYAIGAGALLVVLAIPALSLRFGVMSDATLPGESSARRAHDVAAAEFGPGAAAPNVVVVRLPKTPAKPISDKLPRGVEPTRENIEQTRRLREYGQTKAQYDKTMKMAQELRQRLRDTPGVASADRPLVRGNAALIRLAPEGAPQDKSTADLTHRIRAEVLPPVMARYPGGEAHLGGATTVFLDMADKIRERMLVVIGVVIGVSLLLLVTMFRSILVPLKAALMNLLSIGASYGVVIAVFQWGWGANLVGLDQAVPIISFVPLFMFALIFGLSMDYEVFLLSRVKEEYDRTGDPRESVVRGIGATARLITSAALIMIAVFLSFLPQPDPMVKMMSVGLAVAVAVDVTIVRLVLVPALMSLLGHANWWFPGRRRHTPAVAAQRELESASR